MDKVFFHGSEYPSCFILDFLCIPLLAYVVKVVCFESVGRVG